MKKFDELHFFIDESGNLTAESPNQEIMLLGGVLLFGTYDDKADASLHELISKELSKAGGKFPEDLHFSKSALSSKEKEAFFSNLSSAIKDWAADQRILHGVYIKHKKDIFNSAPDILAEKQFDNRYLSMLWSLVEHLVFVDANVRGSLTQGATIHLHIASRIFFLDLKELKKKQNELTSLGLK
jgi:hypothetical protein